LGKWDGIWWGVWAVHCEEELSGGGGGKRIMEGGVLVVPRGRGVGTPRA